MMVKPFSVKRSLHHGFSLLSKVQIGLLALWTLVALIFLSVLWRSEAVAATNPPESTSGSSNGDFDIELLIPPLAQIGFPAALTNIDFGDFDETFGFQEQQQGFCIFHNTASVTLVAESSRSASGGSFVLAHSTAGETVSADDATGIEYQIEVFGQGLAVSQGALAAGIPTPEFTAANAREMDVPNCTDGSANMQLRLQLASDINFDQKNTGAYSDELTFTVTAE